MNKPSLEVEDTSLKIQKDRQTNCIKKGEYFKY
jgi:hypothetical protein